MPESKDHITTPESSMNLEQFKGMEMVTSYRETPITYTIENASTITDRAVIFYIATGDGMRTQVTVDFDKIKESGSGFEFKADGNNYQIRPKQ